jgi:hypothetical protein
VLNQGPVENSSVNETPNLAASPPTLDGATKTSPLIPYTTIWCLNALVTVVAVGFFIATGMATSDFLLTGGFVFFALVSLPWSLPTVGIGTLFFLRTKQILLRRSANAKVSWRWLGLPAWISARLLIACSLWNCLPQQRLKEICKGNSVAAHNIRVVGATGMQLAEWLATFEAQPEEFHSLVRKLDLRPITAEEFIARIEKLHMLRNTPLLAGLPAIASTNMQCYKWEYTGIDGALHGDIHACFNAKTSRAVVMRSGY